MTDRLSAFDSVLETAIPHKGAVLNGLANFWFEKTAHIIPNHVIKLMDANAMLVKEAEPIKVEMMVRQLPHRLDVARLPGGPAHVLGRDRARRPHQAPAFPAAHRDADHQGGIGPRNHARKPRERRLGDQGAVRPDGRESR